MRQMRDITVVIVTHNRADDDALEYELRVAFWAGVLRERWRDEKRPEGLVAPTDAVPKPNHVTRSQAS